MLVQRWSTAQVLALAPDSSSASGARSVSAAAKWEASGLDGDILWGACKGSGKKPYQTCVDLTGPAYRCSCPSRKFPCKHALGLLVLWAGGHDGGAETPPWVAEWRDRRAAAATRPAARPGSAPADPAAARKRAAQRSGRIAGGLAELDRWLADQAQQGLAALEHVGHKPFEAMAARLVDAQAPTAAGAVRRLGRVAGVGANWADRLLGELALLRLLVAGHARLEELPVDLAATVRSRIGFPVTTDEVLATEPVRDRWTIIGQRDEPDDKLTSRRTWLHGAESGRFALLLAFAAPGQAFAADLVPGTAIDAELCFYPGAHPMRALVARREPGTAPAGAVPVGGPVAEALARWSAALAADPWCGSVPVLLADVVPGADGHLIDASGAALRLRPGHGSPWWLLAAAGGRPVTVSGEYGPSGLRPLAAWVDGRYVPATPGGSGSAHRSELPPALLSVALAGTDRQPWSGAPVPVGGATVAVGAAATPAGLLETVAATLLYRRAGVPAASGCKPVTLAPEETADRVPPAAARRLTALLDTDAVPGGQQIQQAVLGEWLRLAAARGLLLPPEALPDVLDAGRRNVALRPALAVVTGRRGHWLAAQQPSWRYLPGTVTAGPADDGADDELWSTGTAAERLAQLRRLRQVDPAAALRLLRQTFATEEPADRAAFLGALEVGLSPADGEFLESALDDRRKEVRQAAVELLRALPGAALGARMAARAVACVQLQRRALGRDRLVLTLPTEADAGMKRDGVDPKPPRGVGPGAWLLEQIVAATPLATWSAAFGRDPAAVVALPVVDDGRRPWLRGLAHAAIAQRDRAWATALAGGKLDRTAPGGTDDLIWRVHELLPPEELARHARATLRQEPSRATRLLEMITDGWPAPLAEAVVDAIGTMARSTGRDTWTLTELCRVAATRLPAGHPDHAARLARVATGLTGDDAGTTRRALAVSQLVATLTFRDEMHREFA